MARSIHITVGYITESPTDPEPPTDEFGVPGSRPVISERPSSNTSGHRFSTVQEMSGADAVNSIRVAPVEDDGKRYLRRTRILGNLNLNSIQNEAVVFEDCELVAMDSLYGVSAYYSTGLSEPSTWPEFRYCTLQGGTSATIRGGWIRLLKCDISRGVDLLKPFQALEVWGCYMHDNWKDTGSHCDTIQIVNGCSGAIFHFNFFSGFNDLEAPVDPGDWVSGVLQTGTIVGPIGVPDPVQFLDNWVEGGRFAFRGSGGPSDNPEGHACEYIFRRNRFIRDTFQYGPTGNMSGPGDDFDSSNVWDDTGEPVPAYGGM